MPEGYSWQKEVNKLNCTEILVVEPVQFRSKGVNKPTYFKSYFSVSGPFLRIFYILISVGAISYDAYCFSASLLYLFIESNLLEQVTRALRKGGWFLVLHIMFIFFTRKKFYYTTYIHVMQHGILTMLLSILIHTDLVL